MAEGESIHSFSTHNGCHVYNSSCKTIVAGKGEVEIKMGSREGKK